MKKSGDVVRERLKRGFLLIHVVVLVVGPLQTVLRMTQDRVPDLLPRSLNPRAEFRR